MSEVVKAQKRPVIVEAMHVLEGDLASRTRAMHWIQQNEGRCRFPEIGSLIFEVQTLEGWVRVTPGDWVVRGVKGEFYPVRNDIFLETYVLVDEDKVAEAEGPASAT